MRTRAQSPILPFTTGQKPANKRTSRTSPASRVLIIALSSVLVLYGLYEAFGTSRSKPGARQLLSSGSGSGLSAHEEVAQLQGKDSPRLDRGNRAEVAQLQTQGDGHEKSPKLDSSEGVSADRAARASDGSSIADDTTLEAGGLYTMTADDIDGQPVDLSRFAGKVSLVVNVASECGYTESNYRGLQQLYEKYRASGFEVLAFPCNSFGQQEPGAGGAIKDFARQRFGVTFPLFAKVEVDGPGAHPAFRFLAENLPEAGGARDLWRPRWNFSKWLVSKRGLPVAHYDSAFDAAALERDIAAELIRAR